MIEHKFVCHLDIESNKHRWTKFDDSYTPWTASETKTLIKDISEKDDKRMVSFWNLPREKHLAKCGITLQQYKLYHHIVQNKLNNVLVLEDDALRVSTEPINYPDDCVTYLGGYFQHNKLMNTKRIDVDSVEGFNECLSQADGGQFCIMMTMSYIIPKWEIAEELILHLDSLKRWRSIDIMLWKSPVKKGYMYPASYVEEEIPSTLRNKRKKTNIYYQIINWGKDHLVKY
tara:strand:- start:689 stop:1378 length:690 start_codon:yes stop_codon:yes gene_type:complete